MLVRSINTLWLLLLTTCVGCMWGHGMRESRQAKIVDPVLPLAMSRNELVEYLNRHTAGLQAWRCANTSVSVSMPGLPLPQKLKGSIACASPGKFRLIADGAMLIHADFGSNDDHCWAYVKPGEGSVWTWRHEDSHLLQYLPDCPPRLEPSWLMTVLGVQPINAEDYELTSAPQGSRELWLVALETAPDGSTLRRTIKVDTVTGTIREHALYDENRVALLRVQLGQYRQVAGYRMPHSARIRFEKERTELTLAFATIQPDCTLSAEIWKAPQARGLTHVDLGDVARQFIQDSRQNIDVAPTGYERDSRDEENSGDEQDLFSGTETVERPGDFDDAIQEPEFDIPTPPRPSRRSWFSNPFRRK